MARDFPPGVKLWVTEFNVMYAQVWQGKADGTAHAAAAFLNSTQVIPTPSHVLGRISPIFSPFFLVFCVHRLDEAVPTSPKPEPRAKKQPAGEPRVPNSALRSTPQMQWEGSPG